MIIDTSALIAILRNEPEAPAFAKVIESATKRRMSAVNFLEAAVVIDRNRDPIASRRFDELVSVAEIDVESVTLDQAQIGREADRDFEEGSGHPAQLNFGDCFAYALAKATGEPLLFKVNDFNHVDIEAVHKQAGDHCPIDPQDRAYLD